MDIRNYSNLHTDICVCVSIEVGEGEDPLYYAVSVKGDIPEDIRKEVEDTFCRVDWYNNCKELSPGETLYIQGTVYEGDFYIHSIKVNEWKFSDNKCFEFSVMCDRSMKASLNGSHK